MTKDEIDKFFDSLTPEELQKRWKKYEHLDNVGVTVNDFLEFNKNHNPYWKPNEKDEVDELYRINK